MSSNNLDDILGPRLYLDGVASTAVRRRRWNLVGGPTVTDDAVNGRLNVDFGPLKVYLRQVTVVEADLDGYTTPGFTAAINLGAVLSVASHVLGVSIALATPFTGGGIGDMVADIGSSGDQDAIVDGANLLAAAVDGQCSSMPPGIARHKRFAVGTQLRVSLYSTGAMADLTAGAATFYVLLAPTG